MKKHYLLLLFTVFITTTAHSQTITNIRATQDDKDILVTYDLHADDYNLRDLK
jgi:hypothetical protein